MELHEITNYTVRMLPCSIYETVIMENWLEELAQQGLVLHNMIQGIGIFEKQQPQVVRYRLSVIPSKTDGYDNLDSKKELITLCNNAGWQFICERGHFAIFMTADASAEELHTEPDLVYLDYKDYVNVRSLLWSGVLLLMVCYVMWSNFISGGFFLNWTQWGSVIFLPLLAIMVMNVVLYIRRLVCPMLLYQKLKQGGISHEKKPWRGHALRYRALVIGLLILYFGGLGLAVDQMMDNLINHDMESVSIAEYEETSPVPTLDEAVLAVYPDAVPVEGSDDMGMLKWKRLLAPTMCVIEGDRDYQLSDGTVLECRILVEYYETRSPWVATRMAKEEEQAAHKLLWYEPVGIPDLEADYAIAYQAGYPTILLVEEETYVNVGVSFGGRQSLQQMEQWGNVFAESLTE